MKTYLYHRVPENMIGNILYPLNELKSIDQNLYEQAKKKYTGREFVMEQRVPILHCLWNDVLHFSALHPIEIKKEFENNGKEFTSQKFYKIDPHKLDQNNTIVYLFKHQNESEKFQPENWTVYDPSNLDGYTEMSDQTKNYYKMMFEKDDQPLLWAYVPHIMYRGSVDISDCEIVEI